MMIDIFGKKKKLQAQLEAQKLAKVQEEQKERREKELFKKEKRTTRNIEKTNAINRQSLDVLKQTINAEEKINCSLDEFNEKIVYVKDLIQENEAIKAALLEKENFLKEFETRLNERNDQMRKEEITFHIKSEGLKKDEKRILKKDSDLDEERRNIKEREKEAEEIKNSCTEKKEKFEKKINSLEKKEAEAERKEKELNEREEKIFSDEKRIDIKLKEIESLKKAVLDEKNKFETEKEEIKSALDEKIKNYDLKISDIEESKKNFDDAVFDYTDDGIKAKLVVKEAIRAGTKQLEECLEKFRELDSRYCEGTFKGFSVPFNEINDANEQLKVQYEAVKEHAESTGLDFGIWISKIEEELVDAGKNLDSYYFADAYRHIVKGLSYCEGYSDMILIFNSYAGSEEESEVTEEEKDDWDFYWKTMFEEKYEEGKNYFTMDENLIKKQYKKMARKYHPDYATEEREKEECEAKTKLLNEIWEKIKAYFSEKKCA